MKELKKLLQHFKGVIASKPGRAQRTMHRIVTDGSSPTRQRPYRIPPALKKDVCDELQVMMADGLIEELSSEWSSPLVIVKKKDSSNWICVDYRKLNAVTLPNATGGRDAGCHRKCEVHLDIRPRQRLLADTDGGTRPREDHV